MSEFLQRLEQEILSRNLFPRGEAILTAVSGGPDSLTLLHALHALAGKWRWKLVVAHFNHQLRGRDSDADERMVSRTAARLSLPLVAGRADVGRFARTAKLSIEMAARKWRHEFLARVAGERGIRTVALAHHADDQVELFFLRLLRGAGGGGLAGMKWRSPSPANPAVTLVRPLLGFSKADLLECARERRLRFRADASNRSNDFLRNRVRNELLPLLRAHYQPGLEKAVLRLMEIVGAESDLAGRLAQDWLASRRPAFASLPVALQRRILQGQLIQLGTTPDFELVESLRQGPDAVFAIGAECTVARNRAGDVRLGRAASPAAFEPARKIVVVSDGAGKASFGGVGLAWRMETHAANKALPNRVGRELFDADRTGDKIMLRHWQPGDRFQPIGYKSAAKLQDLFTNAKIPRDRRRELVLAVATGGEIFWVEGLRISEHFKLTTTTRRRLVWTWGRGKPPDRRRHRLNAASRPR